MLCLSMTGGEKNEMKNRNPYDCMDYLNSVAINLDPCQNVKMQKHKNLHFGTGPAQFGMVHFVL